MSYDDIVGQQQAKERLRTMVREHRVPHALLFVGSEGSGHLPAAFVFAQHLFCTAALPEGPCGTCSACQQVSKLVHPDLHLVFPIIKSKTVTSCDMRVAEFREAFLTNKYLTLAQWTATMDPGNKQPFIPVEEAASIIRKLSYTSFSGKYRVMVIWQPEKMNAESANRLLKILEEPPADTIFILIASQPDQLLATIISRVQQLKFYPCSDQEIIAALKKQYGVNETVAAQAALLSEGNYAEAVSQLVEQDEGVSLLQRFASFMRLAIRNDAAATLQWIDENAAMGRERQKQFFQYALQVFRDCLMLNYGEPSLLRVGEEEKSFLQKFAPFVTQNNYSQLINRFNEAYFHIERNANPKILFMDLLHQSRFLLHRK